MRFVLKLTGMAIVLGAVFMAGYLKGSLQMDRMDQVLVTVRAEMRERIAGLESEIRSLRIRMHLSSARDRLLAAQNNIKERNLGSTEKDLESVKEALRKTARLTSRETGKKLEELQASIDRLIQSVRRSDPRVREGLEAVKTDLDGLLDR